MTEEPVKLEGAVLAREFRRGTSLAWVSAFHLVVAHPDYAPYLLNVLTGEETAAPFAPLDSDVTAP